MAKQPAAFPEPATESRSASANAPQFQLTITGVDADGKLFREKTIVRAMRERACGYRSTRKLELSSWVMVEILSNQKGGELWKGEAQVRSLAPAAAGNGQLDIDLELEKAHNAIVIAPEEPAAAAQPPAEDRRTPGPTIVRPKEPNAEEPAAAPQTHHASNVTPVRQSPAAKVPFSEPAKPAAQAQPAVSNAEPLVTAPTAAAQPAAAQSAAPAGGAAVQAGSMEASVMASVRSFMGTEIHRQREEMKAQVSLEIHKSVQAELQKSLNAAVDSAVVSAVNTAMNTSMVPTVNQAVSQSLTKAVDQAVKAELDKLLAKSVKDAVAAEMSASLAKSVNQAVSAALVATLDKAVGAAVEPVVAKHMAKMPAPEVKVTPENVIDLSNRVVKHLELTKVQEQIVKQHREACALIAQEAAATTSESLKEQIAGAKSEAGAAIDVLLKKLDDIRSQAVSVLDSLQTAARQSGMAYRQAQEATAKLTDATSAATNLMNQNMHSAAEAQAGEFTRKLERMQTEKMEKFAAEIAKVTGDEIASAQAAAQEKAAELAKEIEKAREEQEERVQELIKITGTLVQREVKNALGKLAGNS
jgi:hypothetical protein